MFIFFHLYKSRRSGSVRHSPRLKNKALTKKNDDVVEENDKKPTPSLTKGNNKNYITI